MLVREELKKLDLHFIVDMGEVDIMEDITTEQREQIRKALLESGLELMDDKKSVLIEKIKAVIIEMVHYTEELPKINFSNFLSEKLHTIIRIWQTCFRMWKEPPSKNSSFRIKSKG